MTVCRTKCVKVKMWKLIVTVVAILLAAVLYPTVNDLSRLTYYFDKEVPRFGSEGCEMMTNEGGETVSLRVSIF